jgi:hypothetical protein
LRKFLSKCSEWTGWKHQKNRQGNYFVVEIVSIESKNILLVVIKMVFEVLRLSFLLSLSIPKKGIYQGTAVKNSDRMPPVFIFQKRIYKVMNGQKRHRKKRFLTFK